jgi:hypothetical protein
VVVPLEEGCGSMERCERRGPDNGFLYIRMPGFTFGGGGSMTKEKAPLYQQRDDAWKLLGT